MKKGKSPRCEVAMLVDEETGTRLRSGRFVPDRHSVEAYVFESLRASYRNVAIVPFDPKIVATIEALRALKPRIVFNLTEWIDGDRTLDQAITGLPAALASFCKTLPAPPPEHPLETALRLRQSK